MFVVSAFTLLLGAPPAPTPAPSPSVALLGQWESVARTPEGVGNILEFHPDGRVTQISASMAEADYRIVDDRLITTWKDPATGKVSEVETHVEFEGNARFLEKSDDDSGDTWSERIGAAPREGSPIVGRWCFLFLETLTSYREFTNDKMYNRLPVVTLRGRYSVAGDRLTVTMQDQPSGEYPFRFEDGRLVIQSRNGTSREYKRPGTTLLQGY
ncbi:MAG TPA: hypothetical protein VMH79_08795 [Thermoanaerobaculia bacterium]|nr:hypothetical protein [Thermoanaerobaculia bacterium]